MCSARDTNTQVNKITQRFWLFWPPLDLEKTKGQRPNVSIQTWAKGAASILSLCRTAIWHQPVWQLASCTEIQFVMAKDLICFPHTIEYPADVIASSLMVYEGVKMSDKRRVSCLLLSLGMIIQWQESVLYTNSVLRFLSSKSVRLPITIHAHVELVRKAIISYMSQ